MNIISGKYAVSCTPEGSYYAYSLMHEQCCAYGESEEEALENLETMESELHIPEHTRSLSGNL